MSNLGPIKIFSSHCWDYNNHRKGLHDLMAPTWVKNVDYVDLSIPRAHPVDVESDLALAAEIRDRIRESDVFLIFAGMYVNFSDWVKFEIHCAFADSCPIISVAPFGQERLSRTATRFADRQVYWRGESIRTAIWELLPEQRRLEYNRARRLRIAQALHGPSTGLRPPSTSPLMSPSVFDLLGAPPPKKWP